MQENASQNGAAKSWSGRFSEPVAELVKRYTASVDFDKRMAEFDIQGSLAHAQMLNKAGVLSAEGTLPQSRTAWRNPRRNPHRQILNGRSTSKMCI